MPHFDHIVVAIEENRGYSEIIGSGSTPYINALASQGALFTNSHATQHPSGPNYLSLFAGSTLVLQMIRAQPMSMYQDQILEANS